MGTVYRSRYYFAWSNGWASLAFAGFDFLGWDEKDPEKALWGRGCNSRPLRVRLPTKAARLCRLFTFSAVPRYGACSTVRDAVGAVTASLECSSARPGACSAAANAAAALATRRCAVIAASHPPLPPPPRSSSVTAAACWRRTGTCRLACSYAGEQNLAEPAAQQATCCCNLSKLQHKTCSCSNQQGRSPAKRCAVLATVV